MYSRFQLARKYLHYYLTASNGKGHGIHSPFVYDFVRNVLNDHKSYPVYEATEKIRRQLLHDTTTIEVADFGAGSSVIKTNTRIVQAIAASSLKPKKYAQLLHRIVSYYKPQQVLELGTSLGVTSAYLAAGNAAGKLFTCEGSVSIAAIARKNFQQLGLDNIELTEGDFADTLSPLLKKMQNVDLAFIDGNHRKDPTLEYFEQLLRHTSPHTILIFDDIHWSSDMEQAWAVIKEHPQVTLTIDLFFIGIVLINPDFKTTQHFTIRF